MNGKPDILAYLNVIMPPFMFRDHLLISVDDRCVVVAELISSELPQLIHVLTEQQIRLCEFEANSFHREMLG
jgi:hypothetical protein